MNNQPWKFNKGGPNDLWIPLAVFLLAVIALSTGILAWQATAAARMDFLYNDKPFHFR